jgi:hypothetical protein
MSRAMRDSVSQRSFYGDSGMHYMQAMHAVTMRRLSYSMLLSMIFTWASKIACVIQSRSTQK